MEALKSECWESVARGAHLKELDGVVGFRRSHGAHAKSTASSSEKDLGKRISPDPRRKEERCQSSSSSNSSTSATQLSARLGSSISQSSRSSQSDSSATSQSFCNEAAAAPEEEGRPFSNRTPSGSSTLYSSSRRTSLVHSQKPEEGNSSRKESGTQNPLYDWRATEEDGFKDSGRTDLEPLDNTSADSFGLAAETALSSEAAKQAGAFPPATGCNRVP